MVKEIKDKHIVYSLGGGCYPYWDISQEYRCNSILKGTIAGKTEDDKSNERKIFLPYELFNGNLEQEFLYKDFNWKFETNEQTWDYNEYVKSKQKDHSFLSSSLAQYNLVNVNNGLIIVHCQKRLENPVNKNSWKSMFRFFNENKYNLLFLIDFQRAGYECYTNNQLLKFENYLIDNKFNLNNFIYIDVDNAIDKHRFDNCKIPTFIQKNGDEKGFSEPYEYFRNPLCFFAYHMDYVDAQVNRILGL